VAEIPIINALGDALGALHFLAHILARGDYMPIIAIRHSDLLDDLLFFKETMLAIDAVQLLDDENKLAPMIVFRDYEFSDRLSIYTPVEAAYCELEEVATKCTCILYDTCRLNYNGAVIRSYEFTD